MRGLGMSRMGMLSSMAMASLIATDIVPLTPRPATHGKRNRSTSATYRATSRTTLHETNGKRECARRLRQIAAGSLRVENGLVQS